MAVYEVSHYSVRTIQTLFQRIAFTVAHANVAYSDLVQGDEIKVNVNATEGSVYVSGVNTPPVSPIAVGGIGCNFKNINYQIQRPATGSLRISTSTVGVVVGGTGIYFSDTNFGSGVVYIMVEYTDGVHTIHPDFLTPDKVCTTHMFGYRTTHEGETFIWFHPHDLGEDNRLCAQKIYEDSTLSSEDPYEPGGESDEGGGEGDFDDTSDIIPIPGLPSLSAIDTGFLTLFNPSLAQCRSLSNYLWTDLIADVASGGSLHSVIDDLRKIVSNPYDAILGLSLVPVAIPTAGSKDVKLFGVIDSGVTMPYASTQYVEINCGSLNINEYWGAYMDYSPYTKITSLFLPYIGVVTVNVDEIMNKTVGIVYHVDILSGQCIAYITVDGSVEYQYQGHCAASLPITSADFSNTINAGLNILGSLANVGMGAVGGFAMGGGIGAAVGAASGAMSAAPSIAGNVMNMKPDIKSGGGSGGMGGILSCQKPYLIAIRPRQSMPYNQNHFTGYPSNIMTTVGSCSGYTEFDMITIDNVPLTDEEVKELENILKGGVYL